MKNYSRIALMVADMKKGVIPEDVVSPGAAAQMLGVGRSAISNRLHGGDSLEAWQAEGVILISARSVKAAQKKKQNIPDSQGELNVSTQ